ncbi:MAG: ATP-binding protein [Conexivisphaerales archaeon]
MDYYPRIIELKMDKWMPRKQFLILKGPRQAGKTSLLHHLKEEYGGYYVTLEDEDQLDTFENSPKEFAERFISKNKRNYLFLDEAQYSKKAGKNLKLIYDLFSDRLKIVATGSGSFDIKVQIGKNLVGRATYFELFPLRFEELLSWKAKELHPFFVRWRRNVLNFILGGGDFNEKIVFKRELESLLSKYIVYGGFPEVAKQNDYDVKKELLRNLALTYLEKDVFFFLNVRELEKFRRLLHYLSLALGSMFEFSSVTKEMRMDYRTVEEYVSILINTYIVDMLAPFYKNRASELRKAKKVYFVDTGLRNSILNNFLPLQDRTDAGILLENFILNELKFYGFDVKYWRTTSKAEVDFVIQLSDELIPVEVKGSAKPSRGFYSFLDSYRPKRALVFGNTEPDVEIAGSTKVLYLPYFTI